MSDFLNNRFIKHTRKIHQCDLCLRKIPKGFSAHNIKGVYDGEFFNIYHCNTCNELGKEFYEYVTDGWDGCFDSQALQDSMDDYECSTPLQLLNTLRKQNEDEHKHQYEPLVNSVMKGDYY